MIKRFTLSILLLAIFGIAKAQITTYPKVTGFVAVLQPLTTGPKPALPAILATRM
ncbi:hypothetical protein HK413_00590 [Mucilaginibacter sp. S1162]|uniref:Uncharacterized protein n=1 Tax=Mucilaginibacter humi TaxID=2732510 RepID=A0ABX1W1F9_9SPHI|nr:hypothetical protein [Mucilaginibacter humi]